MIDPLTRYLWKRYLAAVARNRSKVFIRFAAALVDMGYEPYAAELDEKDQVGIDNRIIPPPQGELVGERMLKFPCGYRSVEKLFRLDTQHRR